jgi:hypothetical protein
MHMAKRIAALLGAFMALYLASSFQNGPDLTDANICKTIARFNLANPQNCGPWLDNFFTLILCVAAAACVAFLVWDFLTGKKARMGPALVSGGLVLAIAGGFIWYFESRDMRLSEMMKKPKFPTDTMPIIRPQVDQAPSVVATPATIPSPPRPLGGGIVVQDSQTVEVHHNQSHDNNGPNIGIYESSDVNVHSNETFNTPEKTPEK